MKSTLEKLAFLTGTRLPKEPTASAAASAPTPTPWQLADEVTTCGNTDCGKRLVLCTRHQIDGQSEEVIARGPSASDFDLTSHFNWTANAAHIVSCVNGRAALEAENAALRAVIEALANPEYGFELARMTPAWCIKARAALEVRK